MIYAQAISKMPMVPSTQPYPRECPQGDILGLLIRNFIVRQRVFDAPVSQIGLLDDNFPGLTIGTCGSHRRIFPVAVETPVCLAEVNA